MVPQPALCAPGFSSAYCRTAWIDWNGLDDQEGSRECAKALQYTFESYKPLAYAPFSASLAAFAAFHFAALAISFASFAALSSSAGKM
jgi:hypothetical protein